MIIHNPILTGSISLNGADLSTITGSVATSASFDSRTTYLESTSSILTAASASLSVTSGSLVAASASLSAASGSFNTRVTALEATGSALTSSLTTVSSSGYTTSASLSAASASFNSRTTNLETYTTNWTAVSASFARTGSNNFRSPQYVSDTTVPTGFSNTTASIYTDGGLQVTKDSYFSGSMYIKGNLTIYGTQSIAYITSSQLNIATNLITVNTATPAVRFGGLAVYDSGSTGTGATGSLLWDSQNNSWIYTNPSGGLYDGGMLLMGPPNYSASGNEVGITTNALAKGAGSHHMTSSGIFESGSNVGIGTTAPGNKLTVIGTDGGDTTPATYGGTIKIVDYGISGPQATGGLEFRDSAGYGSKIYTNSANDYLGFASRLGSATWTEHMVIKQATGNVGIGTNSPSGLLQVGVANSGIYFDVSTQYTPKIKAAGTISDIQIESVGSGGNVYLSAPGATSLIAMSVSGSEKLRISSAGNVGIGTTNPTAKLEVKGTADGDLFIGRFHAGSAKLIYGYQLGSDGYLELRTGADAIVTKLSGYTGTPSYFLSNVGINTTSSNSRVTIVDNNAPNASGNITSGTQFAASIASGFASLNVGAYDDGGSNRYGYLRTAYSDNAGVSSEMRFYTGATERMRISTGGIVTMPYQPAFSVANGASFTGPGVLPLKNIIFDDGNNFNTTTYRFTAPVAGRYFFSYYDNIYANNSSATYMEFRVNGTRRGAIAYTATKTVGAWYIMSFQQVIKLSSGDYVEVGMTNTDNADYGGDTSWGNFSGHLIG